MPQEKIRYSFVEQLKLGLVLVVCCITLILTDWLWTWDQNFYDVQMRATPKAAPDDVVIVAVDENSLNDLGRWPWPRNIHALLIDRLNEMGAKTIIMDIIFSEQDRTNAEADVALADSIRRAGNVILPVLVEQTRLGSQLKETLPLSGLIEAGAKLGHVHIELDADGIARSTFLYEGLGNPHWPHLSLAALQHNSGTEIITRPAADKTYSPFSWHRAENRLVPFLGPPGHFKRFSYSDVIKELVNEQSIKGKTVFVGVTATGLGDALPTPVSGLTHPMPGVEINANIFVSLRDNNHIQLMKTGWRIIVSVFIVLLPVVFYPRISPRSALVLSVSLVFGTVLTSLLLLYFGHIWFAPLAVIITLMLSYPLWSWRRLEFTTRYLDDQIKMLSDEPGLVANKATHAPISMISFISEVLSCDGWAIYDQGGKKQQLSGNFHHSPPVKMNKGKWLQDGDVFWLKLVQDAESTFYGLQISKNMHFLNEQLKLLDDFRDVLLQSQLKPGKDTLEIIEHQILQVQSATTRLRAMRRFVSASLDQMADAVIIASSLGEVILYNQQAEQLFGNVSLDEHTLLDILAECKQIDKKMWNIQLCEVISKRKSIHVQATFQSNKDLLIQISPLITSDRINGFIVNFSDITDIKDAERKRSEYINFLSHDLRSPLSSALALIELTQVSDDKNISTNVDRLKQYTERALALTENFVQIARADNIDQINFLELNLLDVVYNATDQLWELASEKNISVDVKTDLTTAIFYGDASLLERALINIIGNAIKYSPGSTRIIVELNSINSHYQCIIRDQGYGIPENEIPNLFTRFHRSVQNKGQNIPGVGLGLAFVKAVVEGHNGTLSVESQVNRGSVFTVNLPIKN